MSFERRVNIYIYIYIYVCMLWQKRTVPQEKLPIQGPRGVLCHPGCCPNSSQLDKLL